MATGPVYMNATPHHSKVKVSLALSSALFIAGQDITGKMEMECRADKSVGVGLIMVELFAIQELNSRDHSASSTFLHTRRLFQGPGLPPSNAVESHPTPGELPLPQGYFSARRGITTFFFRFPLPLSSPSSISFASGLATLRYEVRASVGVAHRGEKRVVTDIIETDVVQCEDMDGVATEHVVVGENGKLYVHGRIIGGRIVSGQQACVELRVKNHSSKKTTGLSLTLTRNLHLHNAVTTTQAPLQLSDTLFSQSFRGAEYCVQAGTEGVANLVFDVPKAARVVKGGVREGSDDAEGGRRRTEPLFEIQCLLGVKIGMGLGHKDMVFEMPVQLSHPATLPDPTPSFEPSLSPDAQAHAVAPDALYGHRSPRSMSPIFHPPHPYFTHSPGPDSGTSSPSYPYVSPPIPSSSASPPHQHHPFSSHIPPYAHVASPTRHLWSPPPPAAVSPVPYYAPDSQVAYYYPLQPMALIPFAYPARPNSAGTGQLHNASPALSGLPTGLPGVEAVGTVYPAVHHRQQQTDLSFDPKSHSIPDVELLTDAGGEEGKGERASRISHHLRMSTRARSMSPTSHRFPTTSSAPPPAAMVHATSPRHQDGPPVLSPRPLLSPRHSFTADAVVKHTDHGTGRSERVDLLEKLVDLAPGGEGQSVKDVLKYLERAEKEMETDKTLPKPPVPSGKAKVLTKVASIPKASEVFGLQPVQQMFEKAKEDKPNKSILRPSPMARRISTDGKGQEWTGRGRDEEIVSIDALKLSPEQHSNGLDALEKRLLLEVGTRKPNAPYRPSVFELGLTATSPVIPHLSASTHPDAGELEISSLALAPTRSTGFSQRKAFQEMASPSTPVLVSEISRVESEGNVKDGISARAVAADKAPATPKERLREEKAKELEAIRLKKAAKGRVADWLGDVAPRPDPTARPLRRNSGTEGISPVQGPSSEKTPGDVLVPASSGTPVSPPKTKTARAPSDPVSIAKSFSPPPESVSPPKPHKPDVLQGRPLSKSVVDTPILSATPAASPKAPSPVSFRRRKPVPPLDETASEETLSMPPPAPEPEKEAQQSSKFLRPQGNSETKYDVRSARGGRGGITTSVAALWASMAQKEDKCDQFKPPARPVTRTAVTTPGFLGGAKLNPRAPCTGERPTPTNENAATRVHLRSEPRQPANLVKSTSVPAAIVPSHARPYLSSTASLARPPSTPLSRVEPPFLSSTLSSSVSEDSSNKVTPVLPQDMAFGQARLKELIKKYQQSAS